MSHPSSGGFHDDVFCFLDLRRSWMLGWLRFQFPRAWEASPAPTEHTNSIGLKNSPERSSAFVLGRVSMRRNAFLPVTEQPPASGEVVIRVFRKTERDGTEGTYGTNSTVRGSGGEQTGGLGILALAPSGEGKTRAKGVKGVKV
jgi:hypothetical protein